MNNPIDSIVDSTGAMTKMAEIKKGEMKIMWCLIQGLKQDS